MKPARIGLASLILALSLGACDRRPGRSAEPASSSTTPGVRPAAAPACAPVPGLDRAAEVPGAEFAKLETGFAEAYRKACAEGLLENAPLVPADAPHPGKLFVINAPDANEVSIYRGGDDAKGDMTLEYHFAASDGTHSAPSAADLHEAIFCAVQGASPAEQDDSGRCLAD